jgi:hypothetical protein
MKDIVSRREFFGKALGLAAVAFAGSSDALGYFNEIESDDPSLYKVFKTDEDFSKGSGKGSIDIWYRNPGGIVSGNSNFDPEWFLYFTSSETNSLTYLRKNRPSAGLNPFLRNGYRIRASPGDGDGEMCINLLPNCLIGGFYEGRNSNNGSIKNNIESVRVSVSEGEMSCSQKTQWRSPFPVMVWEGDASGDVSTGNVFINIENGRFSRISERGISPLRMGATPFYVRCKREARDVFIHRNGRVERRNNPIY